jgi:aminopeptidase N
MNRRPPTCSSPSPGGLFAARRGNGRRRYTLSALDLARHQNPATGGISNTLTLTATPLRHAHLRDVLYQSEAVERAARINNVRYEIKLDLVAGESSYRGDTTLHFDDTGSGDTFVGLRGRHIELLEINGQAATPAWNGYRLVLPGDLLQPANTVRVVYDNDYDTTGDGFHRFVDPEDGAEYVYTNFEPYEAHRLFPCFDQPDIKATYRIDVSAPSSWTIVSNAPVAEVSHVAGGRTRHRFDPMQRYSPYLVALIGGPFDVRQAEHRGLSMAIYARRSLGHLLTEQADEMFEITDQGLDFFAELFDRPFPFAKYDQLFVPEYNSGAMENAGAVTFNEGYLFRDPPTDNQRLDRGEVILHELAHMWFGDLVTMQWWNDLWLNESFATYISYLALTEATRFRNAWKVFNSDIKRWAYQQDQLITTHPISGVADDTEDAFLNFDGITYGKGASVLKQLVRHVGPEGFRDGLRLYFRRHEWDNATLADFLACLAEGSGQNLDEWAHLWLETASLNTLAASWQVADDRMTELTLHQSAPASQPTLRPHAVEIGVGRDDGERLVISALSARIDGAEAQVRVPAGTPAPQLVFPNHGDHAYAKASLDGRSVEYVRDHLDRVEDALLRQLLWTSLWEMVRDCELRSTDFLAIARRWLPAEPDLDILDSVLERSALVHARYVPEPKRLSEAHLSFTTALEGLHAPARHGEAIDRRIEWARFAIASAASAEDIAAFLELVDGGDVNGFSFDQEMRWALCAKAVAHELPDAGARLKKEAKRDRSDRGRRSVIVAETARPSESAKEEAWRRIHDEGYGSFHLTRAAMQGFFWPHQAEQLARYEDDFFARVEDIFETRDHPFARAYMTLLFPAYRAAPTVLEKTRRLLGSLDGRLPTLSRQLAEAGDELERTIRIRAFAED